MTLRTLSPPPTDAGPAPLVLTYAEAAELIGGSKPVSTDHIGRLVKAKKLKRVGRGRASRVLYASVVAYLEGGSRG